ncbi:3,4-dihydroxy-2-butanone-4-phosphate synthase [uncultured Sphingorhabdus sp.]|uniref:3,4-dihydroxy-2-butanone-4-phosphate synthase n=1 Tax=uncultured Sphingorhabdus sp. TaxID=1686106 RepID=UPI002637FE80|nr:3,4-dihydroxy-2-butanone-4-phosphate synthase [uncultured Sphingorhabdus sp.]HMS22041.1 3,4-dihydroxy-2-butanone-4-phosphate synthase [Sphingorhabdus sp.]
MSDLQAAIDALGKGEIIVITGDRFRRGDIDFAIAAKHITADAINFMARHGRGLICLSLTPARAVKLGISLINPGSERQSGRPFGRSIEARADVTTGISAADRAKTVEVAVAEGANSDDLVSPGHVFPLIASEGGTAERLAAAEASIDLCRLAGCGDAAVICSIMRDDGEMARLNDIGELIESHGLKVADIDDLLQHLGIAPEA